MPTPGLECVWGGAQTLSKMKALGNLTPSRGTEGTNDSWRAASVPIVPLPADLAPPTGIGLPDSVVGGMTCAALSLERELSPVLSLPLGGRELSQTLSLE